MKKFMICAFVLSVLTCQTAHGDFCICLIEELYDYGSFSKYDAERRDGACDLSCPELTAVIWYGDDPWPQQCDESDVGEDPVVSPYQCLNNGISKKKTEADIGLRQPKRQDYQPVLAPHLDAKKVKILTEHFIKVVPDDRDPFFAKVFVNLIEKDPGRRPNRPQLVTASGVQVDGTGLGRVPTVKAVKVEGQKNVYMATFGSSNYSIVAVKRKDDGKTPTKATKKK